MLKGVLEPKRELFGSVVLQNNITKAMKHTHERTEARPRQRLCKPRRQGSGVRTYTSPPTKRGRGCDGVSHASDDVLTALEQSQDTIGQTSVLLCYREERGKEEHQPSEPASPPAVAQSDLQRSLFCCSEAEKSKRGGGGIGTT